MIAGVVAVDPGRIRDSESATYSTSSVDPHTARTAELAPFGDELTCGERIWIRLLVRSPTKIRPLESSASECGLSNWPGPVPGVPHASMNLPAFVRCTIRRLDVGLMWPSAT